MEALIEVGNVLTLTRETLVLCHLRMLAAILVAGAVSRTVLDRVTYCWGGAPFHLIVSQHILPGRQPPGLPPCVIFSDYTFAPASFGDTLMQSGALAFLESKMRTFSLLRSPPPNSD